MSTHTAPSHVVWQAVGMRSHGGVQQIHAQPAGQLHVTVCNRSECSSSSSGGLPGQRRCGRSTQDSHSNSSELGATGKQRDRSSRPPLPVDPSVAVVQDGLNDVHTMHKVWDTPSDGNSKNSASGSSATPPTLQTPREAEQSDEEELEEELAQPLAGAADPSGPLPSRGSWAHASGQCQPCGFMVMKKGCRLGERCDHCHFGHHPPRQRKKPCKWRRERAKKQLALSAAANVLLGIAPSGDADYLVLRDGLLAQIEGGVHPDDQQAEAQLDEELPVFGAAAPSGLSRRRQIVSL